MSTVSIYYENMNLLYCYLEQLNEANEKLQTLEKELSTAEEFITGLETDIATLSTDLQSSHKREEELVTAVQESEDELSALRVQLQTL